MSNPSAPPDQLQRERALDPGQSILVQAPAGSGKTDLLTRRFLRLLAEVEEPGQVVAITFTNAAAAEMRHRILSELEKAAECDAPPHVADEFSMSSLARRALVHSQALSWNLLDLPAQLRISTIDSFCRELAQQQPLLSGLGGGLEIADQPADLYRRAARSTLKKIDQIGQPLGAAIEDLLLWRDNGWQEMEELLVVMLGQRDRWMHEFVLDREPDWEALRDRLERPFAHAVRNMLIRLDKLFIQMPQAREEALQLARFACELSGGDLHRDLAELGEFPAPPFYSSEALEEARQAHVNLAALLLTGDGGFRRQVDKRLGFPADRKREKERLLELIVGLRSIDGMELALAAARSLPPARYTEDDWQIVRACFTLLRHAAGELQVVFAEAGAMDFIEVAQIAQRVLRGADGLPTDAALAICEKIRHLLVDEFQDTSRRQHQLLASLIAAWPERPGRSCFAVGDPMQSIYFFRDADAELFSRVKTIGLEIPQEDSLRFEFAPLTANFRTAPSLVEKLNEVFVEVFAANDGSGVSFSAAQPAREGQSKPDPRFQIHLEFVPQTGPGKAADPEAIIQKEAAKSAQIEGLIDLIRSHQERIDQARAKGEKYRIAVLGRARSALAPVAEALRAAQIPFRAVDLEKLSTRPEVLDALGLARALLNPLDRVAWLGVLRAPWCGLSLADLHQLTSNHDSELKSRPVPELLAERLTLLSEDGQSGAARVMEMLRSLPVHRNAQPIAALGTRLEQAWLLLGGASCVDAAARANLDLLWSCLDRLPAGEQDLLGPALALALDKLTALPDPAASSEYGVQLMTIHKSKGLEFELVLVPELQAGGGRSGGKMLAWLERGLAQPDESGEITEFLIAPLQPKGADRGRAKAWVDQVYRERESQETRRILYVAATRAREELHFFARPLYKEQADGSLGLIEPIGSLLATAWPALEAEVRVRFEGWKVKNARIEEEHAGVIESIAAVAESNLVVMPAPAKPTRLRRLPPKFRIDSSGFVAPSIPLSSAEAVREQEPLAVRAPAVFGNSTLYARHDGGLHSRSLGTAVHSLLEEFSRLRTVLDADSARAELPGFLPRIAAQIRAAGFEQSQAAQIAAQALQHALSAALDPIGAWILAPHPDAASEVSWSGVIGGKMRMVRIDRVFRSGIEPLFEGKQCWWIVDYKTAVADTDTDLPELREIFAPQLEVYAQILRTLHGKGAEINGGIYYPLMSRFDWWTI